MSKLSRRRAFTEVITPDFVRTSHPIDRVGTRPEPLPCGLDLETAEDGRAVHASEREWPVSDAVLAVAQ